MKKQKGIIIILTLVYGSIFLLLFTGLSVFILSQHRFTLERSSWEKSLHIAEAGVYFARWRLAHAPTDFAFSGIYDFRDTAGIIIGQYQLQIIAPTVCQPRTTIQSIGWTLRHPEIKRTIQALHARPSLARYAFLTNSNIWFGPGEEIRGMVRSNGGIRMDGTQNSLFFSARETYVCGPGHGCTPPATRSGIWGDGVGGPRGLWQFPVPRKDFEAVVPDLTFLQEEANLRGIFLGPSPLGLGYHLNFKDNGTVDIFQITELRSSVWGFNGQEWVFESNDFNRTTFLANRSLPANCAPIFIEDNVWVSGVINGRTTLVAARFPEVAGIRKNIIIPTNITRANPDSVLALIAQKNILIPLHSPDIMEIEAVLMAQKGRVIRYFYPNWYAPYHFRREIRTFGSIISNEIWTFTWIDNVGRVISGFERTKINYDSGLINNSPPHFPVYGEYEIINWREL